MDPKQQQMIAMLGTGMANRAGNQVAQVPRYQEYAIQAQTMGMEPLPQNDPNWVMHYQQMMQPQMPQGLLSQ